MFFYPHSKVQRPKTKKNKTYLNNVPTREKLVQSKQKPHDLPKTPQNSRFKQHTQKITFITYTKIEFISCGETCDRVGG